MTAPALAFVERQIGLSLSGIGVAVLALGGWAMGYHFGGRSLYLLAYVCVAMLIVAVVIARRRRPISAERSAISRRARVGQSLEVKLALTSQSRITTFRIEEQLHPHLGRTVVLPVPVLGPGEELFHSYTLRPKVRGVYTIGPLTAEFSDPMGLARRRQLLIDETELIVHPNTEEAMDRPLTRAFEDPPLRPPKPRRWPEGFEFYGMRDYVRGDDLRRVIWRAFARTERLMVREFEQGISDRISIVLDTDETWHSPGVPSDSFETAVRVAASVGVRHIKDGFNVDLEINPNKLGSAFRGPRSRLPFLDELARVQLSSEPLSDALERLARGGRRDSHVVIVTSHLDSKSAARANLLVNDGASLTVCVVLWEEADQTTIRRANEIGAQVVQVKPGAALPGVFRASLLTNSRAMQK
jgi:uncharacterized protein (DUF58 family)